MILDVFLTRRLEQTGQWSVRQSRDCWCPTSDPQGGTPPSPFLFLRERAIRDQ